MEKTKENRKRKTVLILDHEFIREIKSKAAAEGISPSVMAERAFRFYWNSPALRKQP